jgi:exopolyphosphatase/guanosine-5'-triphosphate,3'-diphosphate pyrophosphatase
MAVLSGEDEARLTFLAVRRWFGWSAPADSRCSTSVGAPWRSRADREEAPSVAWSLPLGAARLARTWFPDGVSEEAELRPLRKQIRADIARDAGNLLRSGPADHGAASSKTFRSLGSDLRRAPGRPRDRWSRASCR